MSCWILSTVRTGSSYLCNILNKTNLFTDIFCEKFPHFDCQKNLLDNLPSHTKVHYSQFKRFLDEADKDHIETILTNLKYILITRHDRASQVVSFCIAKKYRKFYLYTPKSAEEWFATHVELTDKELLDAWDELGDCGTKWDKYLEGSEYCRVEYQDLVDRPKDELQRVLSYLQMAVSEEVLERAVSSSTMFRMTKPENEVYVQRLKKLNIRI
jgi:LPS sulfotransferase NodH